MTNARLLAIALIFFCTGCQTISGTVPAPASKEATGVFRAGAGKEDITPPPGFPMGGFSIIGRTARGYWTRLFARAIYLEDHEGDAIVLVICDLWSIPGGLSDRVAELVAREEAGRHLGRGQIVLAATHTHHSPGNFSTSPMYNQFASPRAGFDARLFDFLAHRIAAAIVAAARTAEPARARWTQAPVGGVARNRSFDAFALNPDAAELLDQNAQLDAGSIVTHVPTADAYRAIDPTLTVLRLARAGNPDQLIAAAGFYAVHATAMGPQSEVYSSDLFGVATTLMEQSLAASQPEASAPPVVALFNGAEGDVSPNWVQQDRVNTLRVGSALAGAMESLLREADRPLAAGDRPDVGYQFDRFAIAGARFESPAGVSRQTAVRAQPGASQLGGAEDGRTPLFALGWNEGVTGLPTAGQGPKQNVLNPWGLELPWFVRPLLRALTPALDVPRVLPAGVYQAGDLTFATLPGEFTTMMGRRIARGVAGAQRESRTVVLIGLAGEYLSYFTTPEEYAAQHYEGGSTLYGPESGPLVAHELARLAAALPDTSPRAPRTFSYHTGAARHFDLAEIGAEPRASDDGFADVIQDLETGRPVRGHPQFVWTDDMPRWRKPYGGALTPSVAIEALAAGGTWEPLRIGGVAETDYGLSLVTVALAAAPPASKWAAIWMAPAGVGATGSYRFRVRRMNGQDVCSEPFAVPRPGTGTIAPASSC
jgi:neutral ceramidase